MALILNLSVVCSFAAVASNGASTGYNDIPCPTDLCICNKTSQLATCSYQKQRPSSVPKLPFFVQNVQLDFDYFFTISKDTFEPISHNNIVSLSMVHSSIKRIGNDTFEDLGNLTTLDLSHNPYLKVYSLKRSLYSLKNSNLNLLRFDGMRWNNKDIGTGVFNGVSRNISTLSISDNRISILPYGFGEGLEKLLELYAKKNRLFSCNWSLHKLQSLVKLDLSNNKIVGCDVDILPGSLKELILSSNRFDISRLCPSLLTSNRTYKASNIHILNLKRNNIRSIDKQSFHCLPVLSFLDLSNNGIRQVEAGVFSGVDGLQSLILSGNNLCQNMSVGIDAFDIPSLKQFIFSSNSVNLIYCGDSVSLRNNTKLEEIDFSFNYLPYLTEKLIYLFGKLENLKTLNLRNVYWKTIPRGFLKLFPYVENIILSNNFFKEISSDVFSENLKIKTLLLDSNQISGIGYTTFTPMFWNTIELLNLSSNPFSCDCNLLWFRDKFRQSQEKFIIQNSGTYNCFSPPTRKGLQLSAFNMTTDDCREKSELLTIILPTGSICLVAIISIIVVYKGRWHIRYWVYLIRHKRSEYRPLDGVEFKYDAFVIYCDEDSDFVHNTLLPKIEDEEQYRLCVHFRDFQPGKIIADNIVESMNDSRMAIVVLSKYFCESRWCKFELIIAQDRWLNNESDALLLVMLEDLESDHMTKHLRALIRTTTYVMWTDDNQGQRLFWDQILSTLRKEN